MNGTYLPTYLPTYLIINLGAKMRNVSPGKQKAILAAADVLSAQGVENPTNDQVRSHMGGGSIADISPVMRRWKEQKRHDELAMRDIPEGIKQAGDRFLSQLWIATIRECEGALEKERSENAQSIADIESERDEAQSEIRLLDEKLEAEQVMTRSLRGEVEQLTSKLEATANRLQAALIEKEKFATLADESMHAKEESALLRKRPSWCHSLYRLTGMKRSDSSH
jgi:hypothetical protein